MANTKRLCCEAFVNRASRIPAPIHRFKEAEKRAKTLNNTNKVSSCPPTGHLKAKIYTKKNKYYPPSPSENGCLGCIIEGRTAITTPPKPL